MVTLVEHKKQQSSCIHMMIVKMRTVMDTYTTTRKLRFFFECWSCKTIVLRIGNTNLYNKSTVKRNVKHTSQKSGMATKCCRGSRNDKKQSSKMSKRPRVIAAGVTLFIHLFIYVFVYLFVYLCVYSFMYLFVCSCIYLFIELFACLFIYLFVCLFIFFSYLCVYLFICLFDY